VSKERKEWDAACRAWSLDDGANPEKTGALGERLMYAATDLICLLETCLEDEEVPYMENAVKSSERDEGFVEPNRAQRIINEIWRVLG